LLYSFLKTCVAPPSFVSSDTVPPCSIVFYSVRLARLVVLRPITISIQRRDCKHFSLLSSLLSLMRMEHMQLRVEHMQTLLFAELTPFSKPNGTHAANKRNGITAVRLVHRATSPSSTAVPSRLPEIFTLAFLSKHTPAGALCYQRSPSWQHRTGQRETRRDASHGAGVLRPYVCTC
jgi:hypothetical protein